MSRAQRIVALARSQVGAPYRHLGRDAGGFDCLGLALWIAERLGLTVPPIPAYSRTPSGRYMAQQLRTHALPIRVSQAIPGDFYHMAFNRQPQHIAILVEQDPARIVHADGQRGRVVEHALSAAWQARIRAAYRFPVAA